MVGKALKSSLIGLYNCIPEGSMRHFIRRMVVLSGRQMPRRVLVNKGDCVLQVGTPSPSTVHHHLAIVGDKGRVIVVEPETANFKKLSADPIIAKATNVTLLQRAAWSKKEKLELTVSGSMWDHKVNVPEIAHDNDYVENNYTNTELVQADTVDNMMEELQISHLDYVEIHVNGAEIEVLHGMEKMLGHTTRLHVKAHAIVKETGEPINTQVDQILRNRGFRTIICPKSVSRVDARAKGWKQRAGDVYGARK